MNGFLEQLLHYFDRPHREAPNAPVGGPAAWRGSALAASDVWRERLTDAQSAELTRAVAIARASGRATCDLARDDFPLPTLGSAIDRWRSEVRDGRGFVLVRGLPVADWSSEEADRDRKSVV